MAAFASFGQGVEEQLAGYSAHMAQTLAGTLAAPVATALTAWFTWRAWTILFGGRRGNPRHTNVIPFYIFSNGRVSSLT